MKDGEDRDEYKSKVVAGVKIEDVWMEDGGME